MKWNWLILATFTLSCLSFAQQLPEPVLASAQMPQYPPVARLARIEGEVKVSFLLNNRGEVASLEVLSGPPMLRELTAATVKSWKFGMPNDLFRTEWKYETTFRYHMSGRELESNETAKLTIVIDSFHRIDVMSDTNKPIVLTNLKSRDNHQ
jgi:TonB family protein